MSDGGSGDDGGADVGGGSDIGSGMDSDGDGPVALIAPSGWEVLEEGAAADPFAQLRAGAAACDPEGYQVELLSEETVFSVDTLLCNNVTLRQPLLAPIKAGDRVEGRVWHFDLTAPEAGMEAYVAYVLDGERVWEEVLRIPSASGLLIPGWTAEADIAAGTPIYAYVGNHGSNSWSIIDLMVVPP